MTAAVDARTDSGARRISDANRGIETIARTRCDNALSRSAVHRAMGWVIH